jgi:hypothetical protein
LRQALGVAFIFIGEVLSTASRHRTTPRMRQEFGKFPEASSKLFSEN